MGSWNGFDDPEDVDLGNPICLPKGYSNDQPKNFCFHEWVIYRGIVFEYYCCTKCPENISIEEYEKRYGKKL